MTVLTGCLEAGADVNIGHSEKPLLAAASRGHDECVNRLLQAGASVNQRDSLGNTALIIAARFGRLKCLDVLMKQGADVNAMDNKGCTALIKAGGFSTSQGSCIRRLLAGGALINVYNVFGYNALTQHVILNRNRFCAVDMVLYAAGEGIDPGVMGGEFRLPAFMATTPAPAPAVTTPSSPGTTPSSPGTLRTQCRHAVRARLLALDPQAHLFNRVLRLGLPSSLVRYLLYGVSLMQDGDTAEEEDSQPDFTTLMKSLK